MGARSAWRLARWTEVSRAASTAAEPTFHAASSSAATRCEVRARVRVRVRVSRVRELTLNLTPDP